MTNEAMIDDRIQPISRAVTQRIERVGARPDEQTLPIERNAESSDPLPRAELIRLVTRNYKARRSQES